MMRNYILGIINGVSFVLIFNMLYSVVLQPSPAPQKSNFEVVDTYKGCSIVQWNNGNLSNYKYFLDCEK